MHTYSHVFLEPLHYLQSHVNNYLNTDEQQSPTFLAPETSFMAGNSSMDQGRGDGLGMTQAHHVYRVFYFYCYYISSTSDHQALDPGGWGPLD